MSDTELTVSLPLTVTVDVCGLDFKGLVEAIQAAAASSCTELLAWMVRAVSRPQATTAPGRVPPAGRMARPRDRCIGTG